MKILALNRGYDFNLQIILQDLTTRDWLACFHAVPKARLSCRPVRRGDTS